MSVRTALVTGSARRLGRLIAAALIADGWEVVVHARDTPRAEAAARELGAVAGVGADLSGPAAIMQLGAATLEAFPDGLGLLVNSAGTFERVDAWQDAGLDEWARAMDVNARAPYLLTSTLLPALSVARGCVINISDEAAHEHWTTYPIHAAAKAALESLTLSGAKALARMHVRVNALVPRSILPPDDWDEARITQEDAAGKLGSTDALLHELLALANDPQRTGEILHV